MSESNAPEPGRSRSLDRSSDFSWILLTARSANHLMALPRRTLPKGYLFDMLTGIEMCEL